jgi:hypothetical protein
MVTSNGSSYTHELWDWDNDGCFHAGFGISKVKIAYRRIIETVEGTVYILFKTPSIPSKPLRRRENVCDAPHLLGAEHILTPFGKVSAGPIYKAVAKCAKIDNPIVLHQHLTLLMNQEKIPMCNYVYFHECTQALHKKWNKISSDTYWSWDDPSTWSEQPPPAFDNPNEPTDGYANERPSCVFDCGTMGVSTDFAGYPPGTGSDTNQRSVERSNSGSRSSSSDHYRYDDASSELREFCTNPGSRTHKKAIVQRVGQALQSARRFTIKKRKTFAPARQYARRSHIHKDGGVLERSTQHKHSCRCLSCSRRANPKSNRGGFRPHIPCKRFGFKRARIKDARNVR